MSAHLDRNGAQVCVFASHTRIGDAGDLDTAYLNVDRLDCLLSFATYLGRASGVPHRRLYDCRHTFATWAIESGIELWYLARVMGTSVVQIEDTNARWLKRTDDQLRAAFDRYDVSRAELPHTAARSDSGGT